MKISLRKFILIILSIFITHTFAAPSAIEIDTEESESTKDDDSMVDEEFLQNDASVLLDEEEIKRLKNAYISPYNYLQDPIALNMGYDPRESGANGAYHGGTSAIVNANLPTNGKSTNYNTDIAQIWGQTGRWGGFALGGGATAVFNVNKVGQPDTYATTGVLSLNQAYINYQYTNKVNVTIGNIIITTPWVNSVSSNPGATYAMGNNTYQGGVINVQALPSLLITGFTAVGYLQYPNSWFNQQTYYNTKSGILHNNEATRGTSGVGLTWNPVDSYSGKLWFYNFADYASMGYLDNSYHLGLSTSSSFDFAFQAFSQGSSGSAITSKIVIPSQNTTAGYISSNGIGAKIALNLGNNTSSISYNNIFGRSGSYLNGGMVTPYTYGMETDPLYTTPALTSLAELGSGSAYTIRNSTSFMEKSLKFNLSFSQFFVNQVYSSQANQITEYDASLVYRIPHTTMNVWTRLVYLDQPDYVGGNMWQPRIIYNWTF